MIQFDMPMPKNCADCCFATADYVNGIITLFCMTPAGRKMYAPDLISKKDRPEWCPLKEHEAVEPIITPWAEDEDCNIVVAKRECGKCGYQFFTERPNFCENCGTPILWEGR